MTDENRPGDAPDPADERTREYPTFVYGPGESTPGESDSPAGAEPDDDWPVKGPARGIRLALPTVGLAGVLLLAGGFWGGAALEKSHASASGARGASGIAARFRNALTGTTTTGTTTTETTGGGGFGFGGGSTGTVGTVSVVDGNTLYVLTSAGALVKVTLVPSATISRNAKVEAVGLRPGDTVIVQGAAAANGDVTATSVAATAPGVTSTGFGRGGGFGGGAAAGAGTTTTTAG